MQKSHREEKELCHAVQYICGALTIDGRVTIWIGQSYKYEDIPARHPDTRLEENKRVALHERNNYMNRPWELDAYKYQSTNQTFLEYCLMGKEIIED